MRVILREEVAKLGNAGDVVEVKPGYARNFLLPRGLAVRADERNIKAFEHTKRKMAERRALLEAEAKKSGKRVAQVGRVVVNRACAVDGKLYGSVTPKDIAAAFAERGVEIDRKKIVLSEPLKQLGDFDVDVNLGQGVVETVKVSVEPDAASADAMAKASLEAARAQAETEGDEEE